MPAEWHFFATSDGNGPCDGVGPWELQLTRELVQALRIEFWTCNHQRLFYGTIRWLMVVGVHHEDNAGLWRSWSMIPTSTWSSKIFQIPCWRSTFWLWVTSVYTKCSKSFDRYGTNVHTVSLTDGSSFCRISGGTFQIDCKNYVK